MSGPPSPTAASTSNLSPQCMLLDDPSAADQARQRLKSKSSIASLLSRSRPKSHSSRDKEQKLPRLDHLVNVDNQDQPSDLDPDTARLVQLSTDPEFTETSGGQERDTFQWAVLYENQRGLTLFSTPYYSRLSLLPMDPPPFTIPSASRSLRDGQPTVSLASYPLPDGNWRWVSRTWMVDMRGDGQTQYDGFEYNWSFRSKNWRSEVGHLSAGGWVRRRRWVRLMMRPAQVPKRADGNGGSSVGGGALEMDEGNTQLPPTRAPSIISSTCGSDVWEGDENEIWPKCRSALRRAGRDGRKLELWKDWLEHIGLPCSSDEQHHDVRTNGAIGASPVPIPGLAETAIQQGVDNVAHQKERIARVLRHHGYEILQSFVYPDSRAQFLELLSGSGLLPELEVGSGNKSSLAMLDFWSYASSLADLPKMEAASSHG